MKEAFSKVLDEVHTVPSVTASAPASEPQQKRVLPESIIVELNEYGNLVVSPISPNIETRLRSSQVLFLELRRKVRELTGDNSWSVRYASQVDSPLLPFLHCSSSLEVFIDPMSPYRRPVEALSREGVLVLLRLKSNANYFKTKEELIKNPNMSNQKIKSLMEATSSHRHDHRKPHATPNVQQSGSGENQTGGREVPRGQSDRASSGEHREEGSGEASV